MSALSGWSIPRRPPHVTSSNKVNERNMARYLLEKAEWEQKNSARIQREKKEVLEAISRLTSREIELLGISQFLIEAAKK